MLVQQVNEGVEVVGLDELSHVLRDQVGEAVHSLPQQTVPKLGQLTGQDIRDDLQELLVEQKKSDPDLDQQVAGDSPWAIQELLIDRIFI